VDIRSYTRKKERKTLNEIIKGEHKRRERNKKGEGYSMK
jgi:hypothetical protein